MPDPVVTEAPLAFGALTFVSVVFEAEYALLRLQARSMSKHLPSSLVQDIVVIDNARRAMSERMRAELLTEYGSLADRVRILRPSDIAAVPAATGWRSQQVLKLAVADQVDTPIYVVLDAKNHFIAELSPGFFTAADGRPRANAYSFETHPLRNDLEHVLRYLGLSPGDHVPRFTATVTPFALHTETVRRMMRDIAATSGRDFPTEFIAHDLTEFFLYAGWIIATQGSIEVVHSLDLPRTPTIWPRAANVEGVQEATGSADERRSPLFSIHRNALGRLDETGAQFLERFWTGRGLFASEATAHDFIRTYQDEFESLRRSQRRRDLPSRVLSLPRALRRRLQK